MAAGHARELGEAPNDCVDVADDCSDKSHSDRYAGFAGAMLLHLLQLPPVGGVAGAGAGYPDNHVIRRGRVPRRVRPTQHARLQPLMGKIACVSQVWAT